MKKWMLLGFLVLGVASRVWAQEAVTPDFVSEASGSNAGNADGMMGAMAWRNIFHDFLGTPGRSASFVEFAGSKFIAPKFAVPMFAAPVTSAALAAPAPQMISRGSENDRWQLGVGFAYVKFRSPAIDASMAGVNASVTYFTNDWFGVEGNITAVAGRKIFVDDRTKYGGFTGGPKIFAHQRRWEPWAHALFGMAHVNPQLAGVGKNGVAIQLGGGVDYPAWRQISVCLEGDWVLTRLYSQSQNNFQLVTGVVLHF